MKLLSLELQGFKSFPDKTVIDFASNSTVIVGPNGSGKSNISDAIRWVLAENSPKSIRGSKMEDIIFSGTAARKPSSYAEVSLTLDNTVGAKVAIDYDIVTVTRRYFRSGDSEYYINRKPVRMKDIFELFMNTGIGREGYSIIGQGKIAKILALKSEDRRGIFEEAAGISKYRHKKHEAELKLASVRDNLTRVTDIERELEARIGPLEISAEKARKYLTYYEEKKKTDIALWMYDSEKNRGALDETEGKYKIAEHELSMLSESLTSLESQSEKLYFDSQENSVRIEEIQKSIRAFDEKRQILDENTRNSKNKQIFAHAQSESLTTEKAEKEKRLSKQKEDYENAKKQLFVFLEELNLLGKDKENCNQEWDAVKTQIENLQITRSENITEISDIRAELVDLQVKISSAESMSQSSKQRMQELTEELSECLEALETLRAKMKKNEDSLASLQEKNAKAGQKYEEYTKKQTMLQQTKESVQKQLNNLIPEMQGKNRQIDALTRMEELFEGYAYAVKHVMEAYGRGTLKGIYGPVSRLIRVPGQYSVAVETALGAALQNIVVADEQAAKDAMRLLKKDNAGRATFYPLTSITAAPLNVSVQEIEKNAGYVGMAHTLVSYESKFDTVIKSLLGRTAVFENLESASQAAIALKYRVKITTLDGQVINAGGAYTGGSQKKDSGLFTRSYQIERLQEEESKLQVEKKKLEQKLLECEKEMTLLNQQNGSSGGELDVLKTLLGVEETQRKIYQSQESVLEERKHKLEEEQNRILRLSDEYLLEIENIKKKYTEMDEEAARKSEENRILEQKTNEWIQTSNEMREKIYRFEVLIAEKNKDISISRTAVENAEEEIGILETSLQEISEKLLLLNDNMAKAVERLKQNDEESQEILKEVEKLDTECTSLQKRNVEIEKKQYEIRNQIKEKNAVKENVYKEYLRLENIRNRLILEIDSLTSSLWEEYELTFHTALDLGIAPATAENRSEFHKTQSDLKKKMKALGEVNVGAIEEYNEVKTRYDFLKTQIEDLSNSNASLEKIISNLETEMKEKFREAMERITTEFKKVFRELFGGGSADLVLTDPENILTSGIEINVAPPGKIVKSITLLSGGEQAFVAIALLFAMLNVNPTPFCVLDEIESALDEVNVGKFADYAKKYSDMTQFIMITHRRGTMERADRIYGVTTYDKGISQVLTLDITEIEKRIGVKI